MDECVVYKPVRNGKDSSFGNPQGEEVPMNGSASSSVMLEPYRDRVDESLAELSELGAFYPLITYPAPANDLEDEEALDPLIAAGVIAPRFYG
jgi:hypothetical protein